MKDQYLFLWWFEELFLKHMGSFQVKLFLLFSPLLTLFLPGTQAWLGACSDCVLNQKLLPAELLKEIKTRSFFHYKELKRDRTTYNKSHVLGKIIFSFPFGPISVSRC